MRDRQTPIERLVDASGLRCTACNARKEDGCDCWEPCDCGSHQFKWQCQLPEPKEDE